MEFKNLIRIIILLLFFTPLLFGYTLQRGVEKALDNNYLIYKKLKELRTHMDDLNNSESEYYPKVYISSVDVNDTNSSNKPTETDTINKVYKNYNNSLSFIRSFIENNSTLNETDYKKSKKFFAAYNYLEQVNKRVLQLSESYVELIKNYELIEIAKENLQVSEQVYSKAKDSFLVGVISEREFKNIESFVLLAQSNLAVLRSKTNEAEYKYKNLFGTLPEFEKMQKPITKLQMPSTAEQATLFASKNNPLLLISKTPYCNKAHLEVKIDAKMQKTVCDEELKNELMKNVELSLASHNLMEGLLKNYYDYIKYSKEKLAFYKEEYDLGKLTHIELLLAQNDFTNTSSQIISTEYKRLSNEYRILDSMGLLVTTISETENEFLNKLQKKNSPEIKKEPNVAKAASDSKNIRANNKIEFIAGEKKAAVPKTMIFNYAENSSYISRSSKNKVRELVKLLKKNREYNIKIIGHTSSDGPRKYNKWLSKRRAERFMKILIWHGIEKSRMSAYGMGEEKLLVEDSTPEGMNINRRIELEFIKKI